MSKIVQYPDGYKGVASDKAAAILAKKPDHKIIEAEKPEPPKKPEPKKDKE